MNPAPSPSVLRQVVVSSSAQRRLSRAAELIQELRGDGGRWWIVAPSRRAADAFVRGAVADEPWLGVHRSSWRQWIEAFGPSPNPGRWTSDMARRALLVRATADALAEDELDVFRDIARFPGFAGCLLRSLDDLGRFGLEPEGLASQPRWIELSRLWRRARRLDAEHAILDPGLVLQAAQPRPDVAGVVLLDLEPETPLERDTLLRLVREVPACILTTGPQGTIRSMAGQLDAALETLDDLGPVGLAQARSVSFAEGDGPSAATEDGVTIRSCRSELQEATEAVRTVMRRAEAGVPFDRIAVVLPAPRVHLSAVSEALERAEIPAFSTTAARRPNPSGRAFLALLRCAQENLSARGFAEYLGFGCVPDTAMEAASRTVPWVPPESDGPQLRLVFEAPSRPPLPEDDAIAGGVQVPLRWEQWLTDAAVVGTEERWQRRLAGLAAELRLQAESAKDDTERGAHQRRLASVEALRAFALPLIQRLAGLHRARTWDDWIRELEALATAGLADPSSVLQVLAQLRPLATVEDVSLFEVLQVLTEPLADLRVDPGPDAYGHVWVGTPEEIHGRSFDTVVILGLSEGLLPQEFQEDPLLPESLRETVHPKLLLGPRHRRRQRRAFGACLEAAERHVVLTTARLGAGQGRAQVASQFVLELAWRRGGADAVVALSEPAADRAGFGLGWETPHDPAEAADPLEYDLAVASRVQRHPEPAAALYLIRGPDGAVPHPILVRALRSRSARWRKKYREWDGLVAGPDWSHPGLDDLLVSATGLQTFAQCPLRFWMYSVLRLRDDEPLLGPDQLDPKTRGSIYHDVQFRYVRRCREEGRDPSEALDLLDQTWAEAVRRFGDELFPAIPPVFAREMEGLRTDLRGWWRRVAERNDGFEAIYAELAFGMPGSDGRDPASVDEPVRLPGGARLRGSIDLVERHPDGRLRVTDYKTGRPPKAALVRLGGGEVLQPSLYALAAEQLLGAPVERARLAFGTLRHEFEELVVDVTPRVRDELQSWLRLMSQRLGQGFLPAHPRPEACRFCDYRIRCGHEEEARVQVKDPDRRADLEEQRKLQ